MGGRGSGNGFTFHNVSIKTESFGGNVSGVANLHSTMFLLKLDPDRELLAVKSAFTFHNVSIKTRRDDPFLWPGRPFTFHNVSIKTNLKSQVAGIADYLHSTMFLLKPLLTPIRSPKASHLHSTMFLLKQNKEHLDKLSKEHLHSTMFLLKQWRSTEKKVLWPNLHSTMFLLKL